MTYILVDSRYLVMFPKFPPAAKYALKSPFLRRHYKKMFALDYEFTLISFSINLVVLLNKNCACLYGIG